MIPAFKSPPYSLEGKASTYPPFVSELFNRPHKDLTSVMCHLDPSSLLLLLYRDLIQLEHTELGLVTRLLSVPDLESSLTKSDHLGRDLDQLVPGTVGDRLLERHLDRRRDTSGIVLPRGSEVAVVGEKNL